MEFIEQVLKHTEKSDKGYGELFHLNFKGILKVVNVEKGIGYLYDEKECLYKLVGPNGMFDIITDVLEAIFEDLSVKVKNIEMSDAIRQIYNRKISVSKTYSGTVSKSKNVFIAVLTKYFDSEFLGKLDVSEFELPIMNKQILNLKTGEKRPRTKEDYFTYSHNLDYEKDNTCDFINRVFLEIATNNKVKANYLQRALGCALTADVTAKCFFIFYNNTGNNGKTIILNAVSKILKDLSCAVPQDLLISKKHKDSLDTSNACIVGKRLGTFAEPDGLFLQEESIKKITGGDQMTAKLLYENKISFFPTIKLFMATNNLITFDTSQPAMVNRLRVINFNSEFVKEPTKINQFKVDTELENKMTTTYKNEFFTWLVNGAIDYYSDNWSSKQEALQQPKELESEKQDYIKRIDMIGKFIDETYILDKQSHVIRSQSFIDYQQYCAENGFYVIQKSKFFERMIAKGFQLKRNENREESFYGIRSKNSNDLERELQENKIKNDKEEPDYKALYTQSQNELDEYKKQIAELKAELEKLKSNSVVIQDTPTKNENNENIKTDNSLGEQQPSELIKPEQQTEKQMNDCDVFKSLLKVDNIVMKPKKRASTKKSLTLEL